MRELEEGVARLNDAGAPLLEAEDAQGCDSKGDALAHSKSSEKRGYSRRGATPAEKEADCASMWSAEADKYAIEQLEGGVPVSKLHENLARRGGAQTPSHARKIYRPHRGTALRPSQTKEGRTSLQARRARPGCVHKRPEGVLRYVGCVSALEVVQRGRHEEKACGRADQNLRGYGEGIWAEVYRRVWQIEAAGDCQRDEIRGPQERFRDIASQESHDTMVLGASYRRLPWDSRDRRIA